MIDHIVLDIEIQRSPDEVEGGWEATDKLGLACAVLYDYRLDRYRVYGPDDLIALRQRLNLAERITGYNIWKFDLPVIYGLQGHQRAIHLAGQVDDLLMRIWQADGLDPFNFDQQHSGYSLDEVAGATLIRSKIGHGADAPKWYQAGLLHRVINYCVDDVALERDLGCFMDRYGYVLIRSKVMVSPRFLELNGDWHAPFGGFDVTEVA